jgi:hypothetical protein
MMHWKSDKRLLYVLVPAVLAVWGIIGWQIFVGLGPQKLTRFKQKPAPQATVDKASRSLSLNYPDPFGRLHAGVQRPKPTTPQHGNSPATAKAKPAAEKPKETAKPWPPLRYLGQVKNLTTRKTSAILQLNGSTETVATGSSWQEITVLQCTNDSVQVRFAKEKRWVKK